jgi:hypothetical protein
MILGGLPSKSANGSLVSQAFTANDGGWTHQAKLIEKYLSHGA